MNRPQRQKRRYLERYLGRKWLRRVTATILIGSILHSSTGITNAQQTENKSARPAINNQASYSYTDPASKLKFQSTSSQLNAVSQPLLDPLGRILGCGGELLPDYTGFSVGLYEPNPNDPTGTELGNLVSLTRSELPDIQNNGIPGGLKPNTENSNPYFLTNQEPRGTYNFLFDPGKGQTAPGKSYILVINPPRNSIYIQRRIKLQIIDSTGGIGNNIVRYTATSLDGQPITTTGGINFTDTVAFVPNAETVGLDLLALQFTTGMCQPNQVQIIKSGDRATAEPGDTAIYRLSVKNLSDVGLNGIVATDNLPLGFNFLSKSVRGEINGQAVNVTAERQGSTVTFRTDTIVPRGLVLNIAYAAQLTSDAVRGNGRNTAIVNVKRVDNGFAAKDGPAIHELKIRPGITSDCGTIIGRVFVDKNFDGEQQSGEPGVPNAVVFMHDGNRVTTDPNGLYSVVNVQPGSHTGVLDLSSLPGYTLAPNTKFKERNSQSRLVRLEPGGTVRMNFAVTPTFQEEGK
ncbi:hypothetical protein OGM63_28265 [Plectonema radiosum NIES-515]|uniref:DUF11 domain-containing protein n=1 Tax=Plectonema radiosum NIES-515 TaxID=2986073 RepID=A0ABT3B7J8_9CYAN|nr:hypothetical protein [Plectonema radiosum]MCV3217357.1 hypothetical protein [Plectonema radiosum NIES-515]